MTVLSPLRRLGLIITSHRYDYDINVWELQSIQHVSVSCLCGDHLEETAPNSWWHHQIETFSALLAFCARNLPVTGEFPAQRPVMRSFDVFFDLRMNPQSVEQWKRWWFETLPRSSWRHCNSVAHYHPSDRLEFLSKSLMFYFQLLVQVNITAMHCEGPEALIFHKLFSGEINFAQCGLIEQKKCIASSGEIYMKATFDVEMF